MDNLQGLVFTGKDQEETTKKLYDYCKDKKS